MRNIIVKIFGFLLIASLFACEEDVNYKTEFVENESLFCIINGDSSFQTAVVMKSFEERDNTNNNHIKNVQIRLTGKEQTITLVDTIGDGINEPGSYYYSNNFKPIIGDELIINAQLPSGEELNSSVSVPSFNLLFFNLSSFVIPSSETTGNLSLTWTIKGPLGRYAYLPVLTIKYSVNKMGTEEVKNIEIPIAHAESDNKFVPIYPSVTKNSFQVFSQSAIDRAFLEIAGADTNKSDYRIISGNFELYIMEENLATYFASTQTFKNTFSIKVYEPIFSNVEGGLGVFGAYIKRGLPVQISSSYVSSFGYRN